MWNCSIPALVVVSIASVSDRNPISRAWSCSIASIRCLSVDVRSQLHCCQKTAALSFSAEPRPAVAAAKSCGLFRIATTDPVATISVLTLAASLRRVRSTSLPAVVKRLLLAF
jgi:hypothetical protein